MKWTQQQLFKIQTFPHPFETTLDFSSTPLTNSGLVSIQPAIVTGSIQRITTEKYELTMHVDIVFTVLCDVTLDPMDYRLDFDASEIVSFVPDSSDDVVSLNSNTLDLAEFVWASILLEKPLRIVKEDAYRILEARGIRLVEEEPEKKT